MEKLKYDKPEIEVVYIDDVVVTSGPPDFDATAPDFEWGEWPNNIYEE